MSEGLTGFVLSYGGKWRPIMNILQTRTVY